MNKINFKTSYSLKMIVVLSMIVNFIIGCASTPNLGDMSKLPFTPTREIVSSEAVVNENVDNVFQVVSSVRELNQSLPWAFGVSHLKSEDNEDHAIFTENFTRQFVFGSGGKTHWYTVEYDEKERVYSAVLMDEGIVYGRYRVEVIELEEGQAEIRNSFMYTALNEQGAALLEKTPDSRMIELLNIMNRSAKYYAENGEKLPDEEKVFAQTEPLQEFSSKFYQTSATGTVIGSADESFHMLGGMEELCWVPNWRFNLLYSDKENGRTANNTVIEESGYARYMYLRNDFPLYWHVVQYDKDKYEFQIAMNFSGELLGRLTFKMKEIEGDNTIWDVTFTYASLTDRGNQLMEQSGVLYLDFEDKIKISPQKLIEYAQYHKKTGKVYETSAWWLFKVGASSIWGTLLR